MRWILLIIAIIFVTPDQASAQAVVRRSTLTVMLDAELHYLHTVRRKETLYSIAAAYGVTVNQIAEKNAFVESGIKAGQTLIIPKIESRQSAGQQINQSIPIAAKEPDKQFVEPTVKQEPLLPVDDSDDLDDYGDQGREVSDSSIVDPIAERIVFGPIKQIDRSGPMKVVMMLPFGGTKDESNFVDFFRGATLAFDQIAASGAQMVVEVISTSASTSVVNELIARGALADADLIIGPVYAEVFELVAAYASARRVPIISPLGSAGRANNSMVVEVSAPESTKWDKLATLLGDTNANVVLVTSETLTDSVSLAQLEQLLPASTQRIMYEGKVSGINILSEALRRDMKNVFVVPIGNETLVESLLSRLSTLNATGRNNIAVVGTSRWGRFANMNLELFFKLSVTYPTTYFFDRMDERVGQFYRQYVTSYSSLPTLYSLRGYDVMMIFGGALATAHERVLYSITQSPFKVLQVPYSFSQSGDDASKIINTDWALVQYLPNFKIEVR